MFGVSPGAMIGPAAGAGLPKGELVEFPTNLNGKKKKGDENLELGNYLERDHHWARIGRNRLFMVGPPNISRSFARWRWYDGMDRIRIKPGMCQVGMIVRKRKRPGVKWGERKRILSLSLFSTFLAA